MLGRSLLICGALITYEDAMNVQDFSGDFGGLFTVQDFCRWASIGRTFAYAEMKAGRLSARKVGRRTLIPMNEARRWLSTLPSR